MAPRVARHEIDTPEGPARIHVREGQGEAAGQGTLVLGHGAGGGFGAADLTAVTSAAVAAGWRVVQVEQPWLVAGRRIAVAPPRLDVGWLAVLGVLTTAFPPTHPAAVPGFAGVLPEGGPGRLVVGGRSAGARVACRTAAAVDAAGVLCLAFPLHPPGKPEKSRADELRLALDRPLLVVQGERDPFGGPAEVAAVAGGDRVVAVPGDHGMKGDPKGVAAAAVAWLGSLPSKRSRRSARR
jgi:predicted alpha/beta-hydrolase family hydrolase